jgi:hypothetical protein
MDTHVRAYLHGSAFTNSDTHVRAYLHGSAFTNSEWIRTSVRIYMVLLLLIQNGYARPCVSTNSNGSVVFSHLALLHSVSRARQQANHNLDSAQP